MREWLISVSRDLFGHTSFNDTWDIYSDSILEKSEADNDGQLNNLSGLLPDIWQFMILNEILSLRDIANLRATNKIIKNNIDKAIHASRFKTLENFQRIEVVKWQNKTREVCKMDYFVLLCLVFLPSTLSGSAYDSHYIISESTAANKIQLGWTYSLLKNNHGNFNGTWQLNAPEICRSFLKKDSSILAQRECVSMAGAGWLYLFNLAAHLTAFYCMRNFFRYSEKNYSKKLFFVGLGLLSQIATLAISYWFSPAWVESSALSDLCCRFSSNAFKFYELFMPNLGNFTLDGPWALTNTTHLIKISKWQAKHDPVAIPFIASELISTALITGCSFWRARVSNNHDSKIKQLAETFKKVK